MPQCTAVTSVAGGEPWTFHLVTPERTYLLQAQSKAEQRGWIEALKAVIAVHQGDGATDAQMGLLKGAAFRVLRMLHGLRPLSNASEALREKISALSSALFALMMAVSYKVTHLVRQHCVALKTQAYELKVRVAVLWVQCGRERTADALGHGARQLPPAAGHCQLRCRPRGAPHVRRARAARAQCRPPRYEPATRTAA